MLLEREENLSILKKVHFFKHKQDRSKGIIYFINNLKSY